MAKPVHKDSNDCSSSSLDLFLLPPTQSSFQKGKTIDYHPITSLSDGGPIEFKVSGSGKEFLDLARSYLYLKVKVFGYKVKVFCKDTAGQMEEMDISADPVLNTGLGTRSEWTKILGQTVLIWMVQARLVLQTTLLQACSIKSTSFWVVN